MFDRIYTKIKWLRTQPESVKNRYIFVSAFTIVLIISSLWAGVFKKYERKIDGGKNIDLIGVGEKIKEEIKDKIKIPDLKDLPKIEALPEVSVSPSPAVSPEILPLDSLEASPLVSVSPEASEEL